MDRVELMLEAFAAEPREPECTEAVGIAWIDPDELSRKARRVFMLGADPDGETTG